MKQGITVTGLLLICLCIFAGGAAAITVDGNLDDWGLNALSGPSSDWTVNQTWIPANQAVAFLVEDNDNPQHTGLPGFYSPGVHITGKKNSYTFYDEPAGTLRSTGTDVNLPWGGEGYDLEGMYMLQDAQNIYIAVVTSMPQGGLFGPTSGHDETPSDLAMHFTNAGGKYNYEYGVKIGSQKSPGNYLPGDIVYLPDWQSYGYILPLKPDVMKSPAMPGGGVVGSAQIAYTDAWINHMDKGKINYVIEMAIPKADVGVTGNVALSNFLLTQNCLNDNIYVPEFPTVAISVGAILGIVFMIYIVGQKKQ